MQKVEEEGVSLPFLQPPHPPRRPDTGSKRFQRPPVVLRRRLPFWGLLTPGTAAPDRRCALGASLPRSPAPSPPRPPFKPTFKEFGLQESESSPRILHPEEKSERVNYSGCGNLSP